MRLLLLFPLALTLFVCEAATSAQAQSIPGMGSLRTRARWDRHTGNLVWFRAREHRMPENVGAVTGMLTVLGNTALETLGPALMRESSGRWVWMPDAPAEAKQDGNRNWYKPDSQTTAPQAKVDDLTKKIDELTSEVRGLKESFGKMEEALDFASDPAKRLKTRMAECEDAQETVRAGVKMVREKFVPKWREAHAILDQEATASSKIAEQAGEKCRVLLDKGKNINKVDAGLKELEKLLK